MTYYIEAQGMGRHERRKAEAFKRNRASGPKNTVGVPKGFNKRTWQEYCIAVSKEKRNG